MAKKRKWCIFYLDKKYSGNIEKDLKKLGFRDIKCSIPTVSVFKKRTKGKDVYEEVPLLFNYGFLRLPTDKLVSRPYLNYLKRNIPGISSWVKTQDSLQPKKLRRRVDNAEDFDDFSLVATITSKELRRFRSISKDNKYNQNDEIANITIGDYVTLIGYPFHGIPATVLDINMVTKKAHLSLYPENGAMKLWLPLNNITYSVYRDHDPDKLHYIHVEDQRAIVEKQMINQCYENS